MAKHPDVLIVGGGIWGASTAFHLAQRGTVSVRVVERNFDLAQETTINAAGMIGQIRSSPVLTRAIQYALDLFESFPRQFGSDPGFVRSGSLFLGLTPERMAYFDDQIAVGRRNGLVVDAVRRADLHKRLRGLNEDHILGGYFVEGDGYVSPEKAARSLASAAVDLGADFRFGVRATGVRVEAGRALGVETTAGFLPTGSVVLTAGPWTVSIARALGIDLAVQPIRHQRIRTERWDDLPHGHPVVRIPDLSSYVRPEGRSLIFGHFEAHPTPYDLDTLPREFHTPDIDPPVELMERARAAAARIYPRLGELEIAEYRRGLVTLAPDASYVMGPAPGVANLYLATGCAALGIAGAPAVGRWLAQWVLDGQPADDVSVFRLDRYTDQASDRSWVREAACQAYGSYYAIRA